MSVLEPRVSSNVGHVWFNITELDLRKLKSRILLGPFTVQLGTRVLTNFEINLAPSLLNFVWQAVPVPLVFLNYYRPGLLFAHFGDAKTLVQWTRIHIGLLLYWRCWATCQCPALDSLLDSFYLVGGVVSHLQGFPTFRALASTRVPKYVRNPARLIYSVVKAIGNTRVGVMR
jgi:hypothetical protein